MPIYEYKCNKCGTKLEVIQKLSDQPITVCVKCNGAMSKLISPAGLVFKGSGWYVTDYSSKGKPPAEQSKPGKNQEKVSDKKEEKPVAAEPAAGKTETTT
ncbi:MAG: FmdB family zinc ribbon protein [Nitrospirota bacterium]